MQVWNVLHAARWKYRMQKIAKNSQLWHVSTIRKKLVKQQYLPHMSSQYGELQPTSGWDLMASLGYPSTFQRVSRLGSVTAQHSSSGRQPNIVALNKGRLHLYSAGRPSRWALVHILVNNKIAVHRRPVVMSLLSCHSDSNNYLHNIAIHVG